MIRPATAALALILACGNLAQASEADSVLPPPSPADDVLKRWLGVAVDFVQDNVGPPMLIEDYERQEQQEREDALWGRSMAQDQDDPEAANTVTVDNAPTVAPPAEPKADKGKPAAPKPIPAKPELTKTEPVKPAPPPVATKPTPPASPQLVTPKAVTPQALPPIAAPAPKTEKPVIAPVENFVVEDDGPAGTDVPPLVKQETKSVEAAPEQPLPKPVPKDPVYITLGAETQELARAAKGKLKDNKPSPIAATATIDQAIKLGADRQKYQGF